MTAATGAVLLLLLAGTSPPGAPDGAANGDGACRLLTAGEIAAVVGGRVSETKPTSRAAGGLAISDCFYRAEPFTSSVSLELTRSARGPAGKIRDHWKAMFYGEKEEREREDEPRSPDAGAGENPKGREKESPPQRVDGLGDEAFWLSNPASGVLYVLRGDSYLRVSVGGAGEESAKRQKAVELARLALRRL
jgi:hypothetical protein